MTTRQQLGRGKFREEEDPFLLEVGYKRIFKNHISVFRKISKFAEFWLQEELVDNLRQLKPQGSLLNDRMKSLQRRNILPIAGDRNKRKLKND
uniref:Ribosome biogenesis protein NOP53 n=1 Tax=Heterorhabditis bacteriophora TaxID=37862 RepID=A0A1I7WP98_HETBA